MLLVLLSGLFFGLSYIALGMKKHQVAINPQKTQVKNNTYAFSVGAALLIICLVYIMYSVGVGIGLVYYLGMFTLVHFLVILCVHYAPKKLAYVTGFYFLLLS